MNMSNMDILSSYRTAKQKNKQIRVLSELNACTITEIINILKAGGISEEELPKSNTTQFKKPKEEKKVIEVTPLETNIPVSTNTENIDLPLSVRDALFRQLEALDAEEQALKEKITQVFNTREELLSFLKIYTSRK